MVQLEAWFRSWVPESVFSTGGGRSSVEAWYTTVLDLEEVLSGIVESDVHLFVAGVIKSFDTVDRGVLDRVLSSLGLPALFWVRFRLATGLGQSWIRDGGIPQGCPLRMMLIVALNLPWCRYLGAQEGILPLLYADNLKCVSRDLRVLLSATRLTAGCVRLGGQEPAPSKCGLMSTRWAVRSDMRGWIVTDEGDRWSVELDVRDQGEHLDITFRVWSVTLAKRVRLVIARLVLIFVLPLDFHGGLTVTITMFILGALHVVEASFLADASVRKLRTAVCRVVWFSQHPLASAGAVLSLLDGPDGCDPAFCIGWFRFRICCVGTWPTGLRKFLSTGSLVVLLKAVLDTALSICLLGALLRLGFIGVLMCLGGNGLVCLFYGTLLVLFSIFGLRFWRLGGIRYPQTCVQERAFGRAFFGICRAPCGSLTPTMFGKEIRLCSEVSLLGEFVMVFC